MAPSALAILVVAACLVSSQAASLPRTIPAAKRQVSNGGFTIKAASSASKGRMSSAGATTPTANTLRDSQDVIYMADITIGGQPFTVQFDTGSTDLWVAVPPGSSPIKVTNTTDIQATETYGKGVASGPIQFAAVQLGGYTVPSQAFINADSTQDFEPFPFNGAGILGMSFDDITLSPVNAEIEKNFGADSTLGRSTIANIFAQNPNTPNSFDVALDRADDLDDTSTGTFLIGEHATGYETITSQPKLPRLFPGRWTAGLQGMNVQGNSIPIPTSNVSGAPSGQIVMLLDTGFSLPPLPPPMVDAIYSTIPGAVQFTENPALQWIVPCNGSTNVTFNFGGIDYSIHPLDLTIVDVLPLADSNGNPTNVTFCFNAFQYFTFDAALEGFDGAMGDSFLRNVYASFDFGDGDSSGNSSFMQMLPTTSPSEAYADFVASRAKTLASLPQEIDPNTLVGILEGGDGSSSTNSTGSNSKVNPNTKKPSTTNSDFGAMGAVEESTPTASSDSTDKLTSLVEKYGPVIIGLLAGNLLIGAILCVIGVMTCLRAVVKSGAKSRSINPSYAPVRFKEAEALEDREVYRD